MVHLIDFWRSVKLPYVIKKTSKLFLSIHGKIFLGNSPSPEMSGINAAYAWKKKCRIFCDMLHRTPETCVFVATDKRSFEKLTHRPISHVSTLWQLHWETRGNVEEKKHTTLFNLVPATTTFVRMVSFSLWSTHALLYIWTQHHLPAERCAAKTSSITAGADLSRCSGYWSFTLGLNPYFSANPPYRSLSFFFFRIHYMDFPDCLLLLLRISVSLLFSFFLFLHFFSCRFRAVD